MPATLPSLLPGERVIKRQDGSQAVQVTPVSLLQRRNRFEASVSPVGGSGAVVSGGQTQWQLPQSDLLESLTLNLQLTIATNSGTYTTVTFGGWPNPVPFGVIKRISLSANGGAVNIFSLSGWGLYLYLRSRMDIDPFASLTTPKYDGNTNAALGLVNPSSQTRAFNGGSVAASTTYSFNLAVPLPIAFNKTGELALLRLQNNSIFTLTIEWATLGAGGIITETSASGTGYTVSGTARVKANYIKWLPTDVFEYSSQYNNVKSVLEQTYTIQNGTNQIQLVRNDWYTWVMAEVYNNGAPVAVSSLSNLTLSHSNLEFLAKEDYYTHLTDRFFMHRHAPVDGTIEYDLRRRMGIRDRMDVLDAINDRQIQNLTLGFDIDGSLSLTGTQGCRVITEALVDAA